MKRWFIGWLICVIGLPAIAQNVVYSSLKELLSNRGDTVAAMHIEKRSRNQILLSGGADYRIVAANDESMCHKLRKRAYAVRTTKRELYVNCRKLRYKKLRFGSWYAPALLIGHTVYFSAMPLGSVVGDSFIDGDDVKLGGVVGDALAASSLINHRVYYEIDGLTGRVAFLGKDKIKKMLEHYPAWYNDYLKEGTVEASVVRKYLLRLQKQHADMGR